MNKGMPDKNAHGIALMRAMSSFHHRYRHYRRHFTPVLNGYLSRMSAEAWEITEEIRNGGINRINAAYAR
ncbi:hypothetical protein [Dickeya solani]|uniref:hypothetical protein n=1 Tax=Dickeya solani TaxID=1089444 RepID=UPI0011AEE02A|nr:hypothetical protein [Dickeya solani]MBJ2330470.1 hypothetical protein [Dickeya solani]MBJ2340239.1 hypothetical protein [Dickeya solani]MBJ2342410.1 hypothetical protein [Dickeya solani]MBJ2352963.1 hypothetical protein [Dickeya solani]MCZ0783164.1 hypothetical protein [Dickeya solani]